MSFHKMGIKTTPGECFMLHDELAETEGGLQSAYGKFVDGPDHPFNGQLTRLRLAYKLGDHRIIVVRNIHSLFEPVVHSYANSLRWLIGRKRSNVGKEIVCRVLSIDPRFNSMSVELQVALYEGQLFALGHLNLQPDKVQTSYRLRHRMFHLQAGIHLQKIEPEIFVKDELHCSGAIIPACPRYAYRCFSHPFS